MNEVLYKAVKQQTADEHLFEFVFNAIEWLDHQTTGLANFHLLFLVRLTRYLGFYPDRYPAIGEAEFFDLKAGTFTRYKPDVLYLAPPHTQHFNRLLQSSFENISALKITNDERRYLLNKILEYYAMHVEGFGNIKSHEVLEDIMN